MQYLCLRCLNLLEKTETKASDYVMSEQLDLCDNCGQLKYIVLARRTAPESAKPRIVTIFKTRTSDDAKK